MKLNRISAFIFRASLYFYGVMFIYLSGCKPSVVSKESVRTENFHNHDTIQHKHVLLRDTTDNHTIKPKIKHKSTETTDKTEKPVLKDTILKLPHPLEPVVAYGTYPNYEQTILKHNIQEDSTVTPKQK